MTTLTRRAALAALVLTLVPLGVGPATAAPPGAVADEYTTNEDMPKVVEAPGVLANDEAPTGENVLCVGGVDTSNLDGSLEWDADGSFIYTPPANYHGAGSENSFTYTMFEVADVNAACEGNPGSTATVQITVTSVNDPPSASADSFQALRNTTLIIGAPGVLSNDSDIDGDSLSAAKAVDPLHGDVVVAADGSFSYTPATGFTGKDTFYYTASDGVATSPQRAVTITVSSIPPINTPTPPPPTPSPTPTPSPEPTLTPVLTPPPVEVTLEPGATPTAFVPPTPQLTGPPAASSPTPSLAPGASPQPGDASGGAFGSPVTILLGLTLIVLIVGIAAAMWAPGWLARRRGEG